MKPIANSEMPRQQFRDAIRSYTAGGAVIKEEFNKFGDTAVFLVERNGKTGNRFDYIRAYKLGDSIAVSVDYNNMLARELLLHMFSLPRYAYQE